MIFGRTFTSLSASHSESNYGDKNFSQFICEAEWSSSTREVGKGQKFALTTIGFTSTQSERLELKSSARITKWRLDTRVWVPPYRAGTSLNFSGFELWITGSGQAWTVEICLLGPNFIKPTT